jgi:hypothetical protein
MWRTSAGEPNHGDHQPLDADVHTARDVVIVLRRDTHDDRHARGLEIAQGALHRFIPEAGMLHVEQHEIAAGRFHDVADAWRGELDDEMSRI